MDEVKQWQLWRVTVVIIFVILGVFIGIMIEKEIIYKQQKEIEYLREKNKILTSQKDSAMALNRKFIETLQIKTN